MVRIATAILLLLHGALHLLGFVKEWKIARVPQLTGTSLLKMSGAATKIIGLFWLLTFLGFAAAAAGLLLDRPWWWTTAAVPLIASQLLIVLYWKDAWAGTIPNILICIAVIVAHASSDVNRMISEDIRSLYASTASPRTGVLTPERIQGLPLCVQKWIRQSNALGTDLIHSSHLKQTGEMRSKPDGDWMPLEAEQYCTYDRPGFVWKGIVRVAPFISLVARDRYIEGRGSMLIKALSVVTIGDSRGSEMDQGTLIRFLAEMVWAPSSLVNDYVHWEPVDSLSARATMTYAGVSGSGIFRFNEQGELVGFEAQRYRESNGAFSLDPWSIAMKDQREFHGLRIPAVSEVTWKLPNGDFTWLKLEVTDADFNMSHTN